MGSNQYHFNILFEVHTKMIKLHIKRLYSKFFLVYLVNEINKSPETDEFWLVIFKSFELTPKLF